MRPEDQPDWITWTIFGIVGILLIAAIAVIVPEFIAIAVIALVLSAVLKMYLWVRDSAVKCTPRQSKNSKTQSPMRESLTEDVAKLGSDDNIASATLIFIIIGVVAFAGTVIFAAPQVLWLIPIAGVWLGIGWVLDRD